MGLQKFDETLAIKKRAIRQGLPYLRLFQSAHSEIRRTNFTYLCYMIAFSGMEFTLTFLAVERFQYSPLQNGLMFVYIGLLLVFVQGGLVRRLLETRWRKAIGHNRLFARHWRLSLHCYRAQ